MLVGVLVGVGGWIESSTPRKYPSYDALAKIFRRIDLRIALAVSG